MTKLLKYFLIFITSILLVVVSLFFWIPRAKEVYDFNGAKAYELVRYQVDLGPRTIGSEAHTAAADWIVKQLESSHWQVSIQESQVSHMPVKNIIASRGTGKPWIILAAHYDTRSVADQDQDPQNQGQPVPGANDGASGVAVLIELSRVLPTNMNKQVWLVFLDAEDNGDSQGNGWSLGSTYFVSTLEGKPDDVVILDMIGDKDLNIYMEKNSNSGLNQEIWAIAARLGYTQFISSNKYAMIDDHIPFIEAGIRAVDIIDFDYPYWHTTADTLDKVSADSLHVVGETIFKWLEQYP